MIAPALPRQGAHIIVTDTGMAEFFKDLELQLVAAGTYRPYAERHQDLAIEK